MATIKDLIGIGPDELEKLSDEELRKRCEPYLCIAAPPEKEEKEMDIVDLDDDGLKEQRTEARKAKKVDAKEQLMREMAKLAKLHGVDLTKTGIK